MLVALLGTFIVDGAAQGVQRRASVVRVVDGDTVEVQFSDEGSTDHLRLIGIDTPEVVDSRKPVYPSLHGRGGPKRGVEVDHVAALRPTGRSRASIVHNSKMIPGKASPADLYPVLSSAAANWSDSLYQLLEHEPLAVYILGGERD
jgi:hypothetical protein